MLLLNRFRTGNPADPGAGVGVDLSIDLPWEHLLCHAGIMYGFHYENLNLDIASPQSILIKVGTVPLHIVFELTSLGGSVRGELFRSPTFTVDGTALAAANLNDMEKYRTLHPLLTTFFTGPTFSAPGTPIGTRLALGATAGAARAGTTTRTGVERVLDANTNYLLRLTSLVNDTYAVLDGTMYEELV